LLLLKPGTCLHLLCATFVHLSCKQALSDAQQFLFEERQRLLHVQSENDELKLQEIQDRQRIQQLLAMTQPLEQTITHRQDGGPPSSVTVYPKPYPQHAQQQPRGSRSPQRGAEAAAGVAAAGSSGERVLRTVFLPTVDCDFLLLKVESLQAQLNEQVRAHMTAVHR
jgi:coiled-coil domain-containing protein 77